MTDERVPRSGTPRSAAECPDFELLSRFADEEVDQDEAALLATHVGSCRQCADLTRRMQQGLGVAEAPLRGVTEGVGCIEPETLILYAMNAVQGRGRREVDTHLALCDGCVIRLSQLHRRLWLAGDVEVSVPIPVQQRAKLINETSIRSARSSEGEPPLRKPRKEPIKPRYSAWLRLPVLVPMSAAAGALLMVSLQESGLMTSSPQQLSRAVEREAQLRVTAVEGRVRLRPSGRSEVVAVVSRGELLDVDDIERDWYRVTLSDGRTGWIERDAFK